MIDYERIRTVVCKGLSEYLHCPIIRANQDAAPPDYPYICYTITTLLGENKGTYGVYEDGTEGKPFSQTWSITALSDDNSLSVELAAKAREWLDRTGNTYLYDNAVTVQSVGEVTNRDNFLTSGYEYRNGFDCVFQVFDKIENVWMQDGEIESASWTQEQIR